MLTPWASPTSLDSRPEALKTHDFGREGTARPSSQATGIQCQPSYRGHRARRAPPGPAGQVREALHGHMTSPLDGMVDVPQVPADPSGGSFMRLDRNRKEAKHEPRNQPPHHSHCPSRGKMIRDHSPASRQVVHGPIGLDSRSCW